MDFSDKLEVRRKLVSKAWDKYVRQVCGRIRAQELKEEFLRTGRYRSVFRQPDMTYR